MVGGSIKSYLLKRVSTVRIRPGAPEICRARYHHGAGLFWSKGRIRTADTRVTNFPAGGVFESARGHQKIMTASRERRRFWFAGAAGGFGPSTPASLISPRGEFSNPPGGHQKFAEPGTTTVPGSSGLKAGFGPPTPASPISPRGEFSNPPGGTRGISSRYRYGAGLFWFMPCQKRSAHLLGEQAGACERICLR